MLKKLLIIDDEPALARLTKKVAESCGFEVTATNHPDEFLDELIAKGADAIVLDLSLPGTDGVELLRFLATSKCRARILIISGCDPRVLETTGKLGTARGLNIAGTLTKPVPVAEMRSALSALNVDTFQ